MLNVCSGIYLYRIDTVKPIAHTWFCLRFSPNQTLVASYIQTDLGGMLPKTLVENALPSNMCDFFDSLKKTLKADGHWKEQ